MSENESNLPKEILDEVLQGLQSDKQAIRMQSLLRLQTLTYSSEAIRKMLEKLAIQDENSDIRKEALAALDLPTHRHVQSRSNKLMRNSRYSLLEQIDNLEKDGLLDGQRAEVIRRRYDFDIDSAPAAPKPVSSPSEHIALKVEPTPQPEPEGPRPSLLQSLL